MTKGRTHDKFVAEKKMQAKIKGLNCPIMMNYYYYLNEKTYMTKETYINHVIRFLEYISGNNISSITTEDLRNITGFTIQQYVMSVQFITEEKEMGNSTKQILYSSINSFMRFLKRSKVISENPFDNGEIDRPKTKDNDIVFLEPEEYAIVRKNIMSGVGNERAKGKQKDWMYRDLLLFQIPIITGVRVTALSQISVDDINHTKKTIRVVDKNKDKTLFLDDRTYGMLLVWLEERKRLMDGHPDCPYIFISNRRTKMDARSIRNVVAKYTEGLDKHITPHKLRSTCGTNLYRATKDIYLVADVLGHSNPATSRKYTKVGSQDRVDASKALAAMMV